MRIRSIIFPFVVVFAFSAMTVSAQQPEGPPPGAMNEGEFRATALRQLGLTRQQLQLIRRLNQDRKPLMDAAQMRLRQANRALDEAIYSDNASDEQFQARLKDFQAAQAEVARLRFAHEFGVRRVLSPDQLMRFRQMRQRFERARQAMPAGRADQEPPRGAAPPPRQSFVNNRPPKRP